MYCMYCGKVIPDGSRFCPACGASQIIERQSDYRPGPIGTEAPIRAGKKGKKRIGLVIGAASVLAFVVLFAAVGVLVKTFRTETKYYVKSVTRYRQNDEKYYTADEDFAYATGKWNEKKHELDLQHYSCRGNDLQRGLVYKYNESGNVIEKYNYSKNEHYEIEHYKEKTLYDQDGRLISIITDYEGGRQTRQWIYNKKKILKKYLCTIENEEESSGGFEMLFEYDHNGNPLKGLSYYFEGTGDNTEKQHFGRTEYNVDKEGNLIKATFYNEEADNDSLYALPDSHIEWDYYDSHGKKGVRKEFRLYVGSDFIHKAEFNENGCLVFEQDYDYDPADPEGYYTRYEYGEYQGKPMKTDNQLAEDLVLLPGAEFDRFYDPAEPSVVGR